MKLPSLLKPAWKPPPPCYLCRKMFWDHDYGTIREQLKHTNIPAALHRYIDPELVETGHG